MALAYKAAAFKEWSERAMLGAAGAEDVETVVAKTSSTA
jgi:hypothetical protein